ncbi:MAG: hypothetical protein WCE40_02340 [Polyangia bacterium]
MAPNEEQDDETAEEKFLAFWEGAGKRKPHPKWWRMFALVLVEQSRQRERQERDARPISRALLKDLQMLCVLVARIRETIARIDDRRQAREAAEKQSKDGLRAIIHRLFDRVFPETTPIERFARKSRSGLDAALGPVAGPVGQAIESLKAEFEALPLTHATQKRGLLFRLKVYQSLDFSEPEMAKLERISVGAVHQARRRMVRDEQR